MTQSDQLLDRTLRLARRYLPKKPVSDLRADNVHYIEQPLQQLMPQTLQFLEPLQLAREALPIAKLRGWVVATCLASPHGYVSRIMLCLLADLCRQHATQPDGTANLLRALDRAVGGLVHNLSDEGRRNLVALVAHARAQRHIVEWRAGG